MEKIFYKIMQLKNIRTFFSFSLKRGNILPLLILTILLLSSCKVERHPATVNLFPQANTEIWGYENLTILYDPQISLPIKNIIYNAGQGPVSIIKEDNPLRSEPGMYEITLCAECLETSKIKVTIEFTDESGQPSITQDYTINHIPKTNITSKRLPNGNVALDASTSKDPEGKELKFSWQSKDTTVHGAKFITNEDLLIKYPILLSISDGVAIQNDIVTYDPTTGVPIYTSEKLKCTDMNVVTTGKSLLNPTKITLGPIPPVNTQLAVDGNNKTTRTYTVSFAFEVRANILPSGDVFDEGQDVAMSYDLTANCDDTKKQDQKGRRRKEPNRSEYEAGEQTAGFPDPLTAPGSHPPMVEDDYDHHPSRGTAFKNGGTGVEFVDVNTKFLFLNPFTGICQMIWLDQPGFWVIPVGTDVSQGLYYQAYFRSWMKESIPPCEKFFIVEIEIDKTGKVVKNQLTMR